MLVAVIMRIRLSIWDLMPSHWIKTVKPIFGIKRAWGYEMSFETMVLTGNNAVNPHGIPGSTSRKQCSLLWPWLWRMVMRLIWPVPSRLESKRMISKRNLPLPDVVAHQAAIDMIVPWKIRTWTLHGASSKLAMVNTKSPPGQLYGMDVHEFSWKENDLVLEEGMV